MGLNDAVSENATVNVMFNYFSKKEVMVLLVVMVLPELGIIEIRLYFSQVLVELMEDQSKSYDTFLHRAQTKFPSANSGIPTIH